MRTTERVEIAFVQDYGTVRNLEEGPFTPTGNPLDLALSGNAYFVVETDQGKRYTRNGHLHVNNEGRLVNATGWPILDEDDRAFDITLNDYNLTIANDGTVDSENPDREGPIGRIQVVTFENEQALRQLGDGLYTSNEDPDQVPVEEIKMSPGMIEESNVQPIIEITRMIWTLRAYQSTQKMMETEHDLQRRAIGRLGDAKAA